MLLKNTNEKETKNNSIIMVYTFNTNNPDIKTIIRGSFNILNSSTKLRKILEKKQLIFAKRQPQNLRSLVCKSTFLEYEETFEVKKCKKSCICCKYLKEGSSINFNKAGVDFKIKNNFDCNSKNVLYVITCGNCPFQYLGVTNNLKNRLNVHRQQARDQSLRQLKVSKHLFHCGKEIFLIFPFYKLGENKNNHVIKEQHFIDKFRPELNSNI